MPKSYIPQTDAEFNTWQNELLAWLDTPANQARLGLTPAQIAAMKNAQVGWMSAFPTHLGTQNAAKVASNAKDAARKELEKPIRNFVAALQKNIVLSDADRVALRITVPAPTRQKSAMPTTSPVATIDFSQRLRHSITFRDALTPKSKSKPKGIRGAQVCMKLGAPPPADPSECEFVATDTATPYVHTFDAADVGKMVYYILRWENTTGAVGPWSAYVSAVVTS